MEQHTALSGYLLALTLIVIEALAMAVRSTVSLCVLHCCVCLCMRRVGGFGGFEGLAQCVYEGARFVSDHPNGVYTVRTNSELFLGKYAGSRETLVSRKAVRARGWCKRTALTGLVIE
jgi:hypothetical protein